MKNKKTGKWWWWCRCFGVSRVFVFLFYFRAAFLIFPNYFPIFFCFVSDSFFVSVGEFKLTTIPNFNRRVNAASGAVAACSMDIYTRDKMIVRVQRLVISPILYVPRPQCFIVRTRQ